MSSRRNRMSVDCSPVNTARIEWDLKDRAHGRYEEYWKERDIRVIPSELFDYPGERWLEVGAGSGWFFVELARLNPSVQLIAIERSKTRGQRLVRKAKKSGLPNLFAFRGNAIPALIHGIPSEKVDRVYLLYPCPWPKTAQRKNRWHLHPIMPHLTRILRPGGTMIWASDQKFYIDEARFVLEKLYQFEILSHGELAGNSYNDLEKFPEGRTKFEKSFRDQGQPCYELVARKPTQL